MKPTLHAESSAKRYGGKMEDYLPIHDLMDSSKAALGDVRHRALTHNSWFMRSSAWKPTPLGVGGNAVLLIVLKKIFCKPENLWFFQ